MTANANITKANGAKPGLVERLPELLIPACVLFNFFLCIVNAKFSPVNATIIIFCELCFIGMAVLYGFYRIDRLKLYWIAVMVLQIAGLLALSAASHELMMKPIRDVIILPVFMIFGLTAFRVDFTRTLIILSVFVLVMGVIEAVYVDQYLDIVNIKSYYINKGTDSDFTYTTSNLFVSGVRPNGRFLFDVPGLHRVSSVFLEPISLGFFAFISFLYFNAIKDRLSKKLYYPMLAVCLLLIWLGDARMAFGSMIFIIILRPLFLRLDHRLSVLVSPVVFALCFLLLHFHLVNTQGEGIGSRVSTTIAAMEAMDVNVLLGVSNMEIYPRDSALVELLIHHGLFGFLLYWLSPIFFLRRASPEVRIYLFGVSIFICLGYLLSAGVFTIKTAALLWFLYGYLVMRYPAIDPENNNLADAK